MTEIEQKALALVNEMRAEAGHDLLTGHTPSMSYGCCWDALCRTIKQHEQFKREVSDALDSSVLTPETEAHLSRFILPKPVDPLVAVMDDFMSMDGGCLAECVEQFRVALARRGLEVREIEG